MRNIIILIACSLLFVQCERKVAVQPTSSFDTLGGTWMVIDRANITYYFQGTGVNGASIYTDVHEDAYAKLAPVFNPKTPRKIRFFVWTSPALAEEILGEPLGFTNGYYCICHVRVNQTLGHEMTHVLAFWANGVEPTSESRFVSEGVAVAFDLRGDDKIKAAKSALDGQNIHSITELWSGNLQNAQEEVFYPIAGAFMEFLYKKNMPDQFNALLKKQTQEEAEVIYGKDNLNAMIAEFNGKVGL